MRPFLLRDLVCYPTAVSRSLKAHILLILVTFVWGATFVMIKSALDDVSPLVFNAVRMVLAAIALIALYRSAFPRMTRASLRDGVVVGIFLAVGYAFQTTGLALTTPSKSAFLTGVSVALVPVFLAIGWKRVVNRWTASGVTIAFVGLYFLTVPATHADELSNLASIDRGDLLTMACAVAFAFQIILLGRAMQRHPFEQTAVLQIATSAVLMSLSAPLLETVRVTWSAQVIWAILITGLLGTAAAFTIQAWAQQFIAPTHTALIFALEPVFAWLTSYIVLDERLGTRAAAGAVMIVAGMVFSELKGATAELKAEVGNELGRRPSR